MGSQEEHNNVPMYERIMLKPSPIKRLMDLLILFLLFSLVVTRVISIITNNYDDSTMPCFLALLCESAFAINWLLTICTRWTPASVNTYPHRLFQRMSFEELPGVDMFVTTADPVAEPPILTVNTVLSLLAVDYPPNKLACYVSDDGCSPLTFYALGEACNFAKLWVPFCKKYNVQLRAPLRYFSECEKNPVVGDGSPEFEQEWQKMKDEYEGLCRRIQDGPNQLYSELADFAHTEKRNHPPIVKVIWENKEGGPDGLPKLIYISREKRPKYQHHYKAGAMNVLTRVSGLMTNAPYTLNLDCDMLVNNPQILIHAMCVLLDPKAQNEVAFVQCLQQFFDGLNDDPFGNQMVALFTYMGSGVAGLQGLFYNGTNCFHRRKVLYGLSPQQHAQHGNNISEETLVKTFGSSKELVKSASCALQEKNYSPNDNVSKSVVEAAMEVASCGYEYGTAWGKEIGWMYGSTTEDVLTGLRIHSKGWRSEMCTPDTMAFTGSAPKGGPASLTQQKRWAIGFIEIFFSKHSPILGTLFGKLQWRQCVAYLWLINWGFRCVSEICYAILPLYCLITNTTFFPKELGIWMNVAVFVAYNIQTIAEYFGARQSMRAWWNNERMSRIISMTAWPFSVLSVILKFMGISETVFEITEKDQFSSSGDDEDASRFTFNESPMFIPGTTIMMLAVIAIGTKLMGLEPKRENGNIGSGIGEMMCAWYLIVCYWPFIKGVFANGKYGIPLSTLCKSAALAFLFLYFCKTNVH